MSQNRLSGIAVLSIEWNWTIEINTSQINNSFSNVKLRKKVFEINVFMKLKTKNYLHCKCI